MIRANYGRILLRYFKNSLIRELSFRAHFLINVVGELGWVVMMLIFIEVIYGQTGDVRGWSKYQYMFLLGTHMFVTSIFEAFFFHNCWRVSELVRTGSLDFVLLRPASAQFLLSFERVNYASLANTIVGAGLCIYTAVQEGAAVTPTRVLLFLLLVGSGIVTLYALLFMFAITSVWLIRQTGLESLWFYTVSIARYPAEIYQQFAAGAFWFILVFVVPILMVANLPANVVMRSFEPYRVAYAVVASIVLLALSTVWFRLALRWYRSASS
jgi:ABC-2 type transport system permease protein